MGMIPITQTMSGANVSTLLTNAGIVLNQTLLRIVVISGGNGGGLFSGGDSGNMAVWVGRLTSLSQAATVGLGGTGAVGMTNPSAGQSSSFGSIVSAPARPVVIPSGSAPGFGFGGVGGHPFITAGGIAPTGYVPETGTGGRGGWIMMAGFPGRGYGAGGGSGAITGSGGTSGFGGGGGFGEIGGNATPGRAGQPGATQESQQPAGGRGSDGAILIFY